MSSKKIACLGAGSLYFSRAISDLVVSDELAGSELVMFDLVSEKSIRMAALGKRLASESGRDFAVRATASLADAVDGADFAVSSIGGSGAGITNNVYSSYYHNVDVQIGAKYGIQQIIADTGGPGAMMMAFRSIPAYLDICREMERRAPNAILFNHSNPMAILCRAMHKYSPLNVVGLCHGVQLGIMDISRTLNIPPHEIDCRWIGTNHYYWVTRLAHKGKDIYPKFWRRVASRPAPEDTKISSTLSEIYGHKILYAPDDHVIEFYPFLAQMKRGVADLPSHLADAGGRHFPAQKVRMTGPEKTTAAVRKAFFREYQKLLDATKLPSGVSDSLTGEGLASILGAISKGRRQICIANLANNGCIPNLPSTAEVEVEAVTDSCGVRGLQMGEAPIPLKGILEKRFAWMELVADAAVKGDRGLALEALMLDEMAILPDKAKAMLDDMMVASRDLLPQFFGKWRLRQGAAGRKTRK
jgi:alpha-galactosidase